MLYYITLILVFWALIYTSARFLKYHRIVRDYKETTTAVVARTRKHDAVGRREEPALDVVLEYTIQGQPGSSGIVVPVSRADEFPVGEKVEIRYYVAGNGAVHIASSGDGPKKMMIGYLAAIVIELIIYVVIWRILL